MREPDLRADDGKIRAWRMLTVKPDIGPADWQAGLAAWFIEADVGVLDPYGITAWYIGCVSLRDMPGVTPANRHYPDAQFELSAWSIDPNKGVTIELYDRRVEQGDDGGAEGVLLTPPDIVFQWHGTTDEHAIQILEAFIRAVVLGRMSPSRPVVVDYARRFDAAWREALSSTVEHFATGHGHAYLADGEKRSMH